MQQKHNDYLESGGAKLIRFDPGSGPPSTTGRVYFLCPCGKEGERPLYRLLQRKPLCRECLLTIQHAGYRITPQEVSDLLDPYGSKLIALSEGGSTQVTYRCSCGVERTRAWATLSNKKLRVAPRCESCNLKQRNEKLPKGPNHPWWRDTVKPDRRERRWSQEDIIWQKQVLEAADFRCAFSGERSKHLQAHHLLSRTRYPAFKLIVSNGASIHKLLHKEFHMTLPVGYGRFTFTPQDFQQFFINKTGREFPISDEILNAGTL